MMHVSYIPRPRLVLTRALGEVIQCEIEQRPVIRLSASKTITVIQQDGDTNADDDTFSMDLALFYEAQKLL